MKNSAPRLSLAVIVISIFLVQEGFGYPPGGINGYLSSQWTAMQSAAQNYKHCYYDPCTHSWAPAQNNYSSAGSYVPVIVSGKSTGEFCFRKADGNYANFWIRTANSSLNGWQWTTDGNWHDDWTNASYSD